MKPLTFWGVLLHHAQVYGKVHHRLLILKRWNRVSLGPLMKRLLMAQGPEPHLDHQPPTMRAAEPQGAPAFAARMREALCIHDKSLKSPSIIHFPPSRLHPSSIIPIIST